MQGCRVSTRLSVTTLPHCFGDTEEGSGWGGGLCSGLQSEGCFPLGLSSHLRSSHHSGVTPSHSFTTNKSSKVTDFRVLHINFISRPPVGCNVRQLEEKLILGVSVSPADSRSRLRDKLLITVQGARAGRREWRSPLQAPSSSHQ